MLYDELRTISDNYSKEETIFDFIKNLCLLQARKGRYSCSIWLDEYFTLSYLNEDFLSKVIEMLTCQGLKCELKIKDTSNYKETIIKKILTINWGKI